MGADTLPFAVVGGGPASQPVFQPRSGSSQKGADTLSGRSPADPSGPGNTAAGPAGGSSSAKSAAGGGAGAQAKTHSTASHATTPDDGSSSGASGSGNAGPDASGSRPSGKARPAHSDDSSGDSRTGQRSTRADGASSTSSSKSTAQPSTGGSGFSAALAQSLAAMPTDGPAATSTAVKQADAGPSPDSPGGNEPGAHPAKHSTPDPVSTALALLEHALAGALMGPPAAAAADPTAAAAPTANASPQSGQTASVSQGTAAMLETQLAASLPPDARGLAPAPAPAGGPSNAAAAAAVGGAAAAALAAAQLAAGPQAGWAPAKPDATSMALSAPVGSSGWTEELGARLTWMTHQGIESASLQLSPEHLGPLQVSISVHNGQASVWFGAAQPDTRAALQQSLPQLRQLFANQGLSLADAGVSRESPRGRDRQSSARAAAPVSGVAAIDHGSAAHASRAGGLGLVDTYA